MAAKSTYHASLGGQSVGRNPLVTRFLRGALRLSTVSKYGPPVRSCIPSRDLAVVLEALCRPPFEPIEEISDPHLTLKTIFLLAISSLKRVGINRPCQWPLLTWTLRPVWPKSFCTLGQGTSRRSLRSHHSLSYRRPLVLLPFGSLTDKSLSVCV